MATFVLNGISTQLEVTADTPLLWALRETAGLTGTKFGCGIGACGACTVHVNGVATRSCITPVAAVEGASITTIEGLATDAGLDPAPGATMRLLPVGHDHGGVGFAQQQCGAGRRNDQCRHHQHLSLCHL